MRPTDGWSFFGQPRRNDWTRAQPMWSMSHVRKTCLLLSVVLLVGSMLSGAQAAAESVLVRDNAFEPTNTKAVVGQGVVWATGASTAESHNVREDRKIFYSGRPFDVEFTYRRVFSAGTFHYFCERHGFRRGGMDGTVKVPVMLETAPAGPDFTVKWATSASNTGTKYTIQYKIGSGAWKTWKSATSALKATFGSADAGKRYTFRAKSLKGDAASKWSPVASLTA